MHDTKFNFNLLTTTKLNNITGLKKKEDNNPSTLAMVDDDGPDQRKKRKRHYTAYCIPRRSNSPAILSKTNI